MSVKITVDNFEQEVLNSEIPVLVDFWAEWCGPCRSLGPVIEELAEDNAGKVKVCKVNVDEERPLAMKFRVMSIPMLVLFKDGKAVGSSVGVRPKPQIQQMLDEVIG